MNRNTNISSIKRVNRKLKDLDSSNNINSRVNKTTFFNLPDMFRQSSVIFSVTYFETAVEFMNRARCYKVRYIALAILLTKKFKISDA